MRPFPLSLPVAHPPATLATGRGGISATQVLAQYRSAQLTATLSHKPSCVEPVALLPVQQPQLIVQLTGTVQMALTRQGHRRTYQAAPGSVFLNTPHQLPYELAWQSEGAEVVQTIQLDLVPALLQQTATAAGRQADQWELLAAPCLADPLLHQLGASLAAALQVPQPADALYVDTITQMVATQLVHRHSTYPAAGLAGHPSLSAERFRQLQDYVQASLDQSITLDSLAAIACLSSYHFCRAFKQATGVSPYQYVLGQRVARARHLLQQGHHSVAQVARAVGYQSAGHFARLFQRQTGQLPTAVLRPRPAAR